MIRFKQWYDMSAMTPEERRLFNVWKCMKARCTVPTHAAYKDYGGRGIKVCERWLNSFKDYFDDVGVPADVSFELDRINNDGNYEPGNVRYVTRIENLRNTRSNRHIEIDGVTKTMCEWADEYGIDRTTMHGRIKMGWTGSALLSNPRGENIMEIDGKTDTAANWARSIPMSIVGFMARWNRGVRGADLLKPSSKKKNSPYYPQ